MKVKTDIVFSSIIIPNGAEFNTVKSLRVKRAKRIDFEVILNSNNKKEIICLEKKYNFIESILMKIKLYSQILRKCLLHRLIT